MSWENRSDFWDEYNYKEIVDILWKNYEEHTKEKEQFIEQIDDSKSILTTPYTIDLKWKKLKFEAIRNDSEEIIDMNLLTNFGEDVLIEIPEKTEGGKDNILTLEYEPFTLIDDSGQEVDLWLKVNKPIGGLNYNQDTIKIDVDDAVDKILAKPIKDNDGNIVNDLVVGKTLTESDINTIKSQGIKRITVKFKNTIRFMKDKFNEIDYSWLEPYLNNDVLEIWVPEYKIHNKLILEMLGPLVGLTKTIFDLNYYSRMYFNMVKALWFVLVNGPTIRNLKIGVYLFFNLPIALKEPSIIEIWEPGHVKLESGEEWTFSKEINLIDGYYDKDGNWQEINGEGDYVPRFTFLVDGPQMLDYINHPKWWEENHYYANGITIEKYSTTYIEVSGQVFEDQTRNLTVLGDFLKRTVPKFVMFALILHTDLDEGEYGGIDEVDITDSTLNNGTNINLDIPLSDVRPQFRATPLYGDEERTFKFDGEIKYDNFGDSLKIKIVDSDGNVLEEPWRIY